MPELVVCVASYQRPDDLRRLLDSLIDQHGVEVDYGIAVVDNDSHASARETVNAFRDAHVPVCYTVEPDPGIPAARNRSLAVALEMGASYAVFIDDDEVATPRWLAAMYRRMNASGADSVSGPVEPIFPLDAPAWAGQSRLFHRPTYSPGTKLDYASTANSMLRLSSIQGVEQPFHPAFRFTGGSDSYLYHSLRARGGRIVWEPDGLVYEYVPRSRISTRWLMARSYRQGITLARCDRMIYGTPRKVLARGLRGVLQIPVGALQFLAGVVFRRRSWRHGLVRLARGAGSIVGLFGVTYEEYRRSASEQAPDGQSKSRN